MAPLVEFMLGRFGTQGAILVTAGFSAACCISGLLMKPIPVVENFIEVEEQKCLIDSGRASSTSSLSKIQKLKSQSFCFMSFYIYDIKMFFVYINLEFFRFKQKIRFHRLQWRRIKRKAELFTEKHDKDKKLFFCFQGHNKSP